jgi:hypothetical protein
MFWLSVQDELHAMVADVLRDHGHEHEADAPAVLRGLAEAWAKAVVVERASFERTITEGGPLSHSGRARRCWSVWRDAADRVERLGRQLGTKRVARPVDPLEAIRRAVQAANVGPGPEGGR